MACKYLEKCPIFAKCITGMLEAVFINIYCKGPKENECKRKILKEADQPVPENLLPNGKTIDILAL